MFSVAELQQQDCEDVEGTGCNLFKVLPQHLPVGTQGLQNVSKNINEITPSEIQTMYLTQAKRIMKTVCNIRG
jgi:hypothetical protein